MNSFATHRAAIAVFLLALVPGLALTATVHFSAERRAAEAFARTADLAVDRVVTRVGQHVAALRASRGLWDASESTVTRDEFVRFLASVDLEDELSGARGIGFAPMIAHSDMPRVEAAIRENYGVAPRPLEPTTQPWRTPVLLLEPSRETTLRTLGYDMYSEPTRRSAMDAALATDDAYATAPVTLVGSEGTPNSTGFLIFLPLEEGATANTSDAPPAAGFVYAAFYGQDLIDAALAAGPPLQVTMDVADTADPDHHLHLGTAAKDGLAAQLTSTIYGREWQFDIRQTAIDQTLQRRGETAVLGSLSVIFALAMAYAVASRQGEAARARELADVAAREADYRDLLVHEMKHRIKNHIARIQSIARQSARGATDVKAFIDTFDARLRSMASVQEILAGTAVPQADVRAILGKELRQVLDTVEVEHLLEGPSVKLEERQAHAFGLVVHELVTNAMKYGGLSEEGLGLKVTWKLVAAPRGGRAHLTFDWQERFAGTAQDGENGAGFGSRLIEASLKGELSGTMTRTFHEDGLDIKLDIPLATQSGAANDKGKPASA